jgi:hypothetical protein
VGFKALRIAVWTPAVRNSVGAERLLYHESFAYGVSSEYSKLNGFGAGNPTRHSAYAVSKPFTAIKDIAAAELFDRKELTIQTTVYQQQTAAMLFSSRRQ